MEKQVEIVYNWLQLIDPNLICYLNKLINQSAGKKGCLLLQGQPGTGKTILVKLIASMYEMDRIGMFSRQDQCKFWLADLVGKDFWIAEEMTLTDEQADLFKTISDGSEYVSVELKNKGRAWLKRKPMVVTSNFPIWTMCPRQAKSIAERCYIVHMDKIIHDNDDINFVHNLHRTELREIMKRIFIDID